MASQTPNLGLHKKDPATDGGLYFDIVEQINNPFDIIDDKLGGQVVSAAPIPVTIPQGVSIVNADRKSRFKALRMSGRTLVNLLGRNGNFESLTGWGAFQASQALDTANRKQGTSGLKLTLTAATGNTTGPIFPLYANKKYVAVIDIKNGNAASGANFFISGGITAAKGAQTVTATDNFYPAWRAYAPTVDYLSSTLVPGLNGASGQYAFYDAARVYEITQAEYDALDTMTNEQIAARYPYVDDMKHVNAVYMQNPGKNLLPPFSEWTLPTSMSPTESYSVVFNPSTVGDFAAVKAKLVANQAYALSYTSSAGNNVQFKIMFYDKTGTFINETYIGVTGTKTFTSPINTDYAEFRLYNSSVGSYVCSSPMLNVGSTALPFEPQQPSYMYLPDCNLRSNVDGSVADQLYMDGYGKPRAVRRFREMVLDGSQPLVFNSNETGYKTAGITAINFMGIANTETVIKYDGKKLKHFDYGVTFDSSDLSTFKGSDRFFISIANTDSGWGESYTPTADEIKAYFYGWVMVNQETWNTTPEPYNNTGAKGWVRRYCGVGTPFPYSAGVGTIVNGTGVPSLPTENTGWGYTPYRLMYQLAQSIDEPINYEGELMLHDGANQIELGTGVVVREAANAYRDLTTGDVSIGYGLGSQLKKRADRFYELYKNNVIYRQYDKVSKSHTPSVGAWLNLIGGSGGSNYDSTAAYSVTYIALDTYLLGIAPTSITGTVTPNIKETVDDAVQAITGLKRDVSVLQNMKAQKQSPQWITATLQNGWENFASSYASLSYYKNELGEVRVRGSIKNGVTSVGTSIFTLPREYRPTINETKGVISYNGTSGVPFAVEVRTNGNVVISAIVPGNVWAALDFTFRAEQ